MRHFPLSVLLALVMTATVSPAFAAGPGAKGQAATTPAYYRYRNAQGVLVMERSIPPEYAGKGYQVLNSFMQVIQDVPPAAVLTEEERRAKAENDASGSRKDAELRKLYSAPQDAERLRDRQLEAMGLKIDHARGQMNQSVSQRKLEVEQAAKLERSGTKVPQHLRDNIDRLTRQINVHESEIKTLDSEQQRLRAEFEPVIARLKVIYPNKVDPVPAVAPAATVVAPSAVPAPATAVPAAAAVVAPAAVAKPAPVVSPVVQPAAAAVVKPVAPPPKPALAPVPAVAKPAPASPAAAKPSATPVAAAPAVVEPPPVPAAKPQPPAKPAAPVATKPPPTPTFADEKRAVPAEPPVVPVAKAKPKAGKAATEAEKAMAKEKAREELNLESEPRSAGGLRPTGF